MKTFEEVLLEQGNDVNFTDLQRFLKMPVVKPRYKISILNPDETVKYEIPSEDIANDGISYSEEYQNGQRKSINITLLNSDGKYTPSINNNIWLNSRFRFDIGIAVNDGNIIWFPRGIYVMGDITLVEEDSLKTVSLQLKDKFAIFESKTGTLEDPYEIPVDSSVRDVVRGIMNFDMGNGYIMDYKAVLIDPSLVDFRTQATIRVEEGSNIGQIFEQLATQMDAEYYYNNVGNLCFIPINETVDDSNKQVIWVFEDLNRELHNLNLTYQNEEAINVVKVVGENVDNGVYSAVVTNDNPSSPICVAQVGRRTAPTYTESSVWNNDLAYDLAKYYLRQSSFVSVNFNCNVSFNPVLQVNCIVEVENSFLDMKREKLLITSISFSSGDGLMNLKLCNTADLPSNTSKRK